MVGLGLESWIDTPLPCGPKVNTSEDIKRFLNRILGMQVRLQNALFEYFGDTYDKVVAIEKREKTFDYGIQDLGARAEEVSVSPLSNYSIMQDTSMAPVELQLYSVKVNRGMTWEMVLDKAGTLSGGSGFYLSYNFNFVYLLLDAGNGLYEQYRPNIGILPALVELKEFKKKNYKVNVLRAERHWSDQYTRSLTNCSHMAMFGKCAEVAKGNECAFGLGKAVYFVLTGGVLAVWTQLKKVFCNSKRFQVLRVRTQDGRKFAGINIPKKLVESMTNSLSAAEVACALLMEDCDSDDDTSGPDQDIDNYLGI